MAKLILTLDGVVLKEFALTKERTTIGRKAHNDVQIDNLAVSGEHAAIVTILNDSFLEDLGSTNGTLVNGQPIKKHFLQNGDLVEIGKYKVKYVNEQGAGTSAADFEKTMVLRAPQRPAEPRVGDTQTGVKTDFRSTQVDTQFNSTEQQAVGRPIPPQSPSMPPSMPPSASPTMATNPAPAAGPMTTLTTAPGLPPATGMQGVIQILSGPNAGRELPLVKALTTLGKPGVQVAVITKRPQGYFITHVEGATVPVVNGQPLNAQAHILNDHDIVELAGVKMEFFYKPTA
jgi:pSer/pThr/pTyr-binding forkhead associated (FHA) protein